MSTDIKSKTSAGSAIDPALGTLLDALHKIVNEGIDIHRCLAVKALGSIGDATSVPVLIRALLDEDEDVRTDAAEALLLLGDADASDQLLENLVGDPCTEVKLTAIDGLARFGDVRVTPLLRNLVEGRSQDITWDEEEFYSTGWDDWVDVQSRAVKALATLGATEAVPEIAAAVSGGEAQDISATAFAALAQLGDEGVSALAGFLDQPDTRLRRRAAAALARVNSAAAVEPLVRALADGSPDVRLAALKARAEVYPADENLAGLLADADTGVRTEAVELLGAYHPETVRGMIEDPAVKVQAAVLSVLHSVIGVESDEALIERLARKINSRSPEISAAASVAYADLAPAQAQTPLSKLFAHTDRPLAIRLGALKGLQAIGSEVSAEALIAGIDDENRQVRLKSMTALTTIAAKSPWPNAAGEALLLALGGQYDPEDEVEEVEATTTDAAEMVEEDEAEESVESDADAPASFPQSTLDAMLADAPGIAPVVGLPEAGIELSEKDMERLAIARRVLGKKKISLEPEIARHDDIRQFAARLLGDLSSDDVCNALAGALQSDDSETVLAAADSLARIGARGTSVGAEATAALTNFLDSEDRVLKLRIIRALASCRDADIQDLLAPLMQDSDSFIKAEAIRALSGNPDHSDSFEALLDDPDPSVRLCAAEALADTLDADAVDRIVKFAFGFEGYHKRQAAEILRDLDAPKANDLFLAVLGDKAQKRVWSVAIEALHEINQMKKSVQEFQTT